MLSVALQELHYLLLSVINCKKHFINFKGVAFNFDHVVCIPTEMTLLFTAGLHILTFEIVPNMLYLSLAICYPLTFYLSYLFDVGETR